MDSESEFRTRNYLWSRKRPRTRTQTQEKVMNRRQGLGQTSQRGPRLHITVQFLDELFSQEANFQKFKIVKWPCPSHDIVPLWVLVINRVGTILSRKYLSIIDVLNLFEYCIKPVLSLFQTLYACLYLYMDRK